MLSWEGLTEKVFAVNAGSSIFFANSDGILLHFNGVFLEKINGLRLKSGAEMDISITKTEVDGSEVFSFRGPTSNFGDLVCQFPNETANDLALEIGSMRVFEITQECFVEDSVIEQRIILNQSRQLIGLQFFVHPGRQPVTVRYGQIKGLSMY